MDLTVKAPAKINLHLKVKDRRPDGFHNLESIFLAVDFGDTLHFEPAGGENALEIAMEGMETSLPVEKNIIFRALSLFREKTGFNRGLKIKVEKRIPLGGGLGGGSSNAASTLLALNKLSNGVLSKDALLEMAACLGSDVPFFVYETPAALVTGRGENIQPIEAMQGFFVLVNPGFHSDTATAFRLLAEARNANVLKKIKMAQGAFSNDFLPIFPDKEKSVYYYIISQLQKLGADFANLSGAGSTCFGLFLDRSKAELAAADMRSKWSFVEVCSSIQPLSL